MLLKCSYYVCSTMYFTLHGICNVEDAMYIITYCLKLVTMCYCYYFYDYIYLSMCISRE